MADAPPPATPPPDTPPSDAPRPDDSYPGEGCVLLWLKFMIVMNILAMVLFTFFISYREIQAVAPDFREGHFLLLMLGGVLNVVFLGAMLRRRMWGYVGLWVVAIVVVAINIAAGMQVAKAVSSLIWLVVVYWVLQLGGERSGWSRLK